MASPVSRRWTTTLILLSLVSVTFLTLAASSNAAIQYQLSTTFANGQSQGGPQPVGIAVDASTNVSDPSRGDVYVTGGSVVNKFTPASAAAGNQTPDAQLTAPSLGYAWGVSVDASNGDVYVTNLSPPEILKFNATGEQQPFNVTGISIGRPAGIAVNPANGHIFVGDFNTNQLYELDATGEYTSNTYAGNNSPEGLAIDSAGHLYDAQNQVLVFDTASCSGVCQPTSLLDNNNGPHGVGTDPQTNNVFVTERTRLAEFDEHGIEVGEPFGEGVIGQAYGVATDLGAEHVYVADNPNNNAAVFVPLNVPDITVGPVTNEAPTSLTLNGNVAPAGGEEVTACRFEYGVDAGYGLGSVPCTPAAPFSSPSDVSADLHGLTSEVTYHYRLVATDGQGTNFGLDHTVTPHAVASLVTEAPTAVSVTHADLNGSFIGNGEDTHFHFEWGGDPSYGNVTPDVDANSPSGPTPTHVTSELTGLSPVTTYHYRIVASNSNGVSTGGDQEFTTLPYPPIVTGQAVTDVHSDSALLHGQVNPESGDTNYYFEYGTGECAVSACLATPKVDIGSGASLLSVSAQLGKLSQDTTYHWRLVAESSGGVTAGPDRTFTTFPFIAVLNDPCPNAHVRQQTGTALLPDCRAYELVSAPGSGGYDVESSLVAGQDPYGGFPNATSPARVLYGIHSGAIPGVSGDPTNKGVDPYIATRGNQGWGTTYVGVPASNPFSTESFSSRPSAADSGLSTFAFGAPGGCTPCFADTSTGIPIHLPDGTLVQGMAGSIDPGPSAKPDGLIAKELSADGSHLIFGSTSQFESDANNGNGDVSIYDRNLRIGVTHVVSKAPGGGNLSCLQGAGSCHSPGDGNGIAALDVSRDGSRIIVAQKVSTDTGGNAYWHLYMNIGDSAKTVDLTPGAGHGALYDGMTEDGAQVYFTTVDKLASDSDESADIYRAEVSPAGALSLTRVSTESAGSGNSDSCEPASNSVHSRWNAIGSEPNCGAVAIGGGGGVAASGGSLYFLSPERLDGATNGVQNAPNLYVSSPGSAPRFIATLESSLTGPQPPLTYHPFLRKFGTFTTPGPIVVDNSGGPSDGDAYVSDTTANKIFKFDSSGHLVTGWGTGGAINLAADTMTIDSSGTLYAARYCQMSEFAQDGSFITQSSNVCAQEDTLAVDPGGNLYWMGGYGQLERLDASTHEISRLYGFPGEGAAIGLAFDPSNGDLYANYGGEAVERFSLNAYGETVSSASFATGLTGVKGLAVDSAHNVYANERNQIVQLDPSGQQVGAPIGAGLLSNSKDVALDSAGDVYAGNPSRGNAAVFAPLAPKPDPRTDSPAVIDSVSSPAARHSGDFQVSPSGEFAVFTSTLSLSGPQTAGHSEVYRYDAGAQALTCVSCDFTGLDPTGDSTLAADGSSLSVDGRVFFNSNEPLVERDSDSRGDVYEWEAQSTVAAEGSYRCQDSRGCLGLISTGTSAFDSVLLGASADGTDAHFFTRDKLVSEGETGNFVRLYDARELGGFPSTPDPVPCKASDECHGAGSPLPPPPDIHVNTGASGNEAPLKCKRGFLKKHNKCLKKSPHKRSRHHKRRHGHG